MYVIASFRSRNETLRFGEQLRSYGIYVTTVNTPKSAAVGCGLSAKFLSAYLPQAKIILSNGKYRSFAGFFTLDDRFNGGIRNTL